MSASRAIFAKSLSSTIAIAGLFFAFSAQSSPAKADFRICNDTKSLIGISLGYRESGNWITEGWWQIPGETCAALVDGDLDSRYYYLFAEDADRGGQWRGDIYMCTSDREFKIEGVKDCFARGHKRAGFFEVDTGNKDSWMVRLTESGQISSQDTTQSSDPKPDKSNEQTGSTQ